MSISKSPAFQFYPSDWLSSKRIAIMSPSQEGAYIRLLCYCWDDENCKLVDDDNILLPLSRLSTVEELRVVKGCFNQHPTEKGYLVHERLIKEKEKQTAWKKKSSLGGKKSGESRRKKARRVVEPNGNSSSLSSSLNKDIICVFNYWQKVHNHKRAKLDKNRKKKINARLKDGYSVGELKEAVDGCKFSHHHMGKNDTGTIYDDIELICRDAKHVDSFRKAKEQLEVEKW